MFLLSEQQMWSCRTAVAHKVQRLLGSKTIIVNDVAILYCVNDKLCDAIRVANALQCNKFEVLLDRDEILCLGDCIADYRKLVSENLDEISDVLGARGFNTFIKEERNLTQQVIREFEYLIQN